MKLKELLLLTFNYLLNTIPTLLNFFFKKKTAHAYYRRPYFF